MGAHPPQTPYREIAPGRFVARGPDRAAAASSIWEAIEARLAETPSRAALTDGADRLTAAVVRRSVLAFPWPASARPRRGERIGIHLPRGIPAVIASLAVWRLDAVYVPIAPDLPRARIEAIARRCGLALILTTSALDLPGYAVLGTEAVGGLTISMLAAEAGADARMPGDTETGDRPCYIAHTSGSSGDPKGVIIPQSALLNRLAAMRDLLGVTASDVFLYKTASSFDVHVWEFALPLVSGALCVVYEQPDVFDLGEVSRLLCEERVTIVGFVPVLLRGLLRSERFLAGNVLRAVLCGGEAWTPALARAVQSALPGRALYNSYGPAETTIAVANWRVPETGPAGEIEIGAPLDNLLFLVERVSAPSASGTVTGRLLIGGAQLATGYVEAASNARFVTRDIDGVATTLYDTGDLVRLRLETGALVFAGRQDGQVKINGVRIELREVEEAMEAIEGIDQAIAYLGTAGQLGVIYTTTDTRPRARPALAAACARALPGSLVPAAFRHVTALPVTANGKVDRARIGDSLETAS